MTLAKFFRDLRTGSKGQTQVPSVRNMAVTRAVVRAETHDAELVGARRAQRGRRARRAARERSRSHDSFCTAVLHAGRNPRVPVVLIKHGLSRETHLRAEHVRRRSGTGITLAVTGAHPYPDRRRELRAKRPENL